MQTVTLGATHLEVTPLAYGTWQFGGGWGPVDERAAIAAIGHARSLGINFFDTAQAYGFGRSERLLHITPAHPGHSRRTATPAIAFLGTGRMGGPMAANLARAGFAVRVWNRTASHAAALTKDGATMASSPAEAAQGAGIVMTMLADGPATEQAANGPDGFLATARGVIWVQMATIGTEWTARLADSAARRGVTFVDAPVSGSQGPARAGQLTILASGPDQARDVLAPAFGRARAGHRLAGPGRQRHQGQAGAQQLAGRYHRDHRRNPLLRPPARPGPRP